MMFMMQIRMSRISMAMATSATVRAERSTGTITTPKLSKKSIIKILLGDYVLSIAMR